MSGQPEPLNPNAAVGAFWSGLQLLVESLLGNHESRFAITVREADKVVRSRTKDSSELGPRGLPPQIRPGIDFAREKPPELQSLVGRERSGRGSYVGVRRLGVDEGAAERAYSGGRSTLCPLEPVRSQRPSRFS